VHAMAHQLGGFYDLPHGVCNAILLPHVQAFNATNSPTAAHRLGEVAEAMGLEVEGMLPRVAAEQALKAIRGLSRDVGIPAGLAELGVQPEDIPKLAVNALKDACGLTNPVQPSLQEVCEVYRAAM